MTDVPPKRDKPEGEPAHIPYLCPRCNVGVRAVEVEGGGFKLVCPACAATVGLLFRQDAT